MKKLSYCCGMENIQTSSAYTTYVLVFCLSKDYFHILLDSSEHKLIVMLIRLQLSIAQLLSVRFVDAHLVA